MGYSNTLSLPSIPGRADYIHYIALAESGIIPKVMGSRLGYWYWLIVFIQ
jgi:23S rRNA A1618 N6-methylase RlmF